VNLRRYSKITMSGWKGPSTRKNEGHMLRKSSGNGGDVDNRHNSGVDAGLAQLAL
jgi:hypothetical protein